MANAWNNLPLRWAGRITAALSGRQRRTVVGRLAAEAHRQPELAAAARVKRHWNSNQTYLQRPIPQIQLHRQRRADFQW